MASGQDTEFLVIGGGVVGAAIAYGLLRRGRTVRLLDEGDDAFRAARGNFGLVWVQGKGAGNPGYARWSCAAARDWQRFAAELQDCTGTDLQLQQAGGMHLCLTDDEMAARQLELDTVAGSIGEPYPYEMLDPAQVARLLPSVGPEVVGGSFSPLDGHVSPLRLLKALHQAIDALGAQHEAGVRIDDLAHVGGRFVARAPNHVFEADRVVLAAGLGNALLAPMLGLEAPVTPVRGQVLVCERAAPFLPLPTLHVRQTGDGSVQIGDSKENVGMDDGTSIDQLSRIAARAVRCFPVLANVNVVRAWGALRVMTPDGLPIYEESPTCPGAFVVTCHSGITLASAHAGVLAAWLDGGERPAHIDTFTADRFHVQRS
ncbi:MAG: FAD-binding oxidoreductase [Denitromonas halophila]|nr:MAG: FAD-binding oxidoreductase [Denitromonas halophila]TVT72027.1 MAG: FAD-binding oxidoreductase [Denitromonas halophila]